MSENSDGVSLSTVNPFSLILFPSFHSLDLPLCLSSWAPPACLNSLWVVCVRRSTCDPLLFHNSSFLFHCVLCYSFPFYCFFCVLCSCCFSLFMCLLRVHFPRHSFPLLFPFQLFFLSPFFSVIHISIQSPASLSLLALLLLYDKKNTSQTDKKCPLLLEKAFALASAAGTLMEITAVNTLLTGL